MFRLGFEKAIYIYMQVLPYQNEIRGQNLKSCNDDSGAGSRGVIERTFIDHTLGENEDYFTPHVCMCIYSYRNFDSRSSLNALVDSRLHQPIGERLRQLRILSTRLFDAGKITQTDTDGV